MDLRGHLLNQRQLEHQRHLAKLQQIQHQEQAFYTSHAAAVKTPDAPKLMTRDPSTMSIPNESHLVEVQRRKSAQLSRFEHNFFSLNPVTNPKHLKVNFAQTARFKPIEIQEPKPLTDALESRYRQEFGILPPKITQSRNFQDSTLEFLNRRQSPKHVQPANFGLPVQSNLQVPSFEVAKYPDDDMIRQSSTGFNLNEINFRNQRRLESDHWDMARGASSATSRSLGSIAQAVKIPRWQKKDHNSPVLKDFDRDLALLLS